MSAHAPSRSQPTEIVATPEGLQIKGSIDFDNAAAIFTHGRQVISQHQQSHVIIDLAQLGDSNTVALAVLVQWLRAFEPRQDIQLINVPDKLQAIIKTSNLNDIFGLS